MFIDVGGVVSVAMFVAMGGLKTGLCPIIWDHTKFEASQHEFGRPVI